MAAIGIVIPAYNAAHYLGATLESVLQQTEHDWLCVVVDDGSSDTTVAVAQQYADRDSRIRVISQSNSGVADARNRGAAALQAEVHSLIFLDNDDLWEPDALATLHAALEQRPAVVAVSALPREINADGDPTIVDDAAALRAAFGNNREGLRGLQPVRWPDDRASSLETLSIWCHIQTTGLVLIRREAFVAVGGFNAAAVPSDDWDLYVRLALIGPLGYVPRLILRKRSHQDNLSTRWSMMKRAEPLIRRRWRDLEGLTPYQRRILRLGHLYAALLRLRWARTALHERRYREAARNLPRCALAAARWVAIEWLGR